MLQMFLYNLSDKGRGGVGYDILMVQLKLNVLSQTSYSCMHTHCHTAHFLYRILIANKNFNCTKILSKIAFPCNDFTYRQTNHPKYTMYGQ